MIFDYWSKCSTRRAEIRRKMPAKFASRLWVDLRSEGGLGSLGIALVFCVLTSALMMLREDVVPYRPGQYVPQDLASRVEFDFLDRSLLQRIRQEVRDSTPNVYKESTPDVWVELQKSLLGLPDIFSGHKGADTVDKPLTPETIPARLAEELQIKGSPGVLTEMLSYQAPPLRKDYEASVVKFIEALRHDAVILPDDEYRLEVQSLVRPVVTIGGQPRNKEFIFPAGTSEEFKTQHMDLEHHVQKDAEVFGQVLRPALVSYTLAHLSPTHQLDTETTTDAQNKAVDQVSRTRAVIHYKPNYVIVPKGVLSERDWLVLRAEKEQYVKSLGARALEAKAGLAGFALVMTVVLSAYIARFQPRVVRNHTRGWAIAGLLLSMLLLAQLAAIGTGSLYLFGVAPTLVVATILAIAYDQRFALGISSMHGILVTAALDQGIGFFLILWVGVLTICFLLDEIRTRSKLIEAGGMTALAVILATIAAGAISLDPIPFIAKNCLFAGAAGLGVGFLVLGILPFIEKAFNITTSMTLLELADASHPLLRKLAVDAPGTYSHSLQVATLCEAAAEAIGANSLLCRVGAYYHDIGKMNKPDYFVENQVDGRNRHINLNPNVSYLIIINHVKDGMAMAREYNLPKILLPFIQQHHGTTLVEFFYDKACSQQGQLPDGQPVAETQYRYNGPKPKTREIAILMLADCVESATRALKDPGSKSIEELVHRLAMKRLLDGQFDEADLTMRDLERIERAMAKTLQGIYHGRVAYPPSREQPASGAAAIPFTAPEQGPRLASS